MHVSNMYVSNMYASSIMQESRLSLVCERVLEKCLAPSLFFGQGTDNMTMILVRLKKPTNNNTDVGRGSSVKDKARRQSSQ